MAEIVGNPALLAEARAVLPALREVAFAKAGEEGVKAVIGRRLATYPQPQRSEGEWNAWWADYFDVLGDVALASLEAAMRAYVALPDSEFMPKPGRLRELAFLTPCRSLSRFQRAARAVQIADTPLPEERTVSPEDAEKIRQMTAEVVGALAAKSVTRRVLPSIAGKPDERGLTPQMRELLARQQAQQ